MTAEPNEILGKIPCRICQAPAVLLKSKKGLAYYTCHECSTQQFARGTSADAKLRALLIAAPAAPAVEKPKPAPEPAPREEKKSPGPKPAAAVKLEPVAAAGGQRAKLW